MTCLGKLIAIGASMGGVEASQAVLEEFPENIPPVVMVVHMPLGFTKLFAARLDAKLAVRVKEAETGDYLEQGTVLIAPAGKHMEVVRQQGKLAVRCFIGDKVQSVIPSVDVLFNSIAEELGPNAVGVILTGLGADGADGLLEMKKRGAETIGQDKATSVMYGMPKVAFEKGAVKYQLPLSQIAKKILSLIK